MKTGKNICEVAWREKLRSHVTMVTVEILNSNVESNLEFEEEIKLKTDSTD